MKGAKRVWILSMILIVFGVYFVQAAVPGVGFIRGIADNMKIPNFRYMFFAIGLITYYYLNKNKFLGDVGNKWVIIALSAFAGYGISAWRLRTDGWEAYLYIVLACMTLRARKSSGQQDKVAGIDAGLMYMVSAGVLAPFNSLAARTPIETAFLTHFLIGVGFPVIIAPIKDKFTRKNEQGESLFKWWIERRDKKKEKQKEEQERLEQERKSEEHEVKSEKDEIGKLEDLEETTEKFAMTRDSKLGQQVGAQAQALYPAAVATPPTYITINATTESKVKNEDMETTREAIRNLEDKNKFLETPKGRAARFVNDMRNDLKKYGSKYWVKIFGKNWNDDRRFKEEFFNACNRDRRVYKDMSRRLTRIKKDIKELKGVIDPQRFEGFAESLIHDYMKDRGWSIKMLKEALHRKAHSGVEVVHSATQVETAVKDVKEGVRKDIEIGERVNKDVDVIKHNCSIIADPHTPAPWVSEIIRRNALWYKQLHKDLEEKINNGIELSGEMREAEKKLKEYFEKEEKHDARKDIVGELEALNNGIGEKTIRELGLERPLTLKEVERVRGRGGAAKAVKAK